MEASRIRKKDPKQGEKECRRTGHPYFADFPTLLLLLLLYTRTNCVNILIAVLFGIGEQTVYDLSHKLLPLLQDRFIPETRLRKRKGRINTLDGLLQEYPELSEVIADGTDIVTRRPKRQQKKNYSGKSKRHLRKTVLITNPKDGLILGRSRLRPGAVHDKRALKEDSLYRKLEKDTALLKRADSAWTGEDEADGWKVNKRATRGHPLTEEEKRSNRKLSKVRIKVEHAIRRTKVFRRIGEITAFRKKGKLSMTLDVAINLANFKQLSRHPINT